MTYFMLKLHGSVKSIFKTAIYGHTLGFVTLDITFLKPDQN